jgi:hypothetical protein
MDLPPFVRWATGMRWQWKVFIPILAVLILSVVTIYAVLHSLDIDATQWILVAVLCFAILIVFCLALRLAGPDRAQHARSWLAIQELLTFAAPHKSSAIAAVISQDQRPGPRGLTCSGCSIRTQRGDANRTAAGNDVPECAENVTSFTHNQPVANYRQPDLLPALLIRHSESGEALPPPLDSYRAWRPQQLLNLDERRRS